VSKYVPTFQVPILIVFILKYFFLKYFYKTVGWGNYMDTTGLRRGVNIFQDNIKYTFIKNTLISIKEFYIINYYVQ